MEWPLGGLGQWAEGDKEEEPFYQDAIQVVTVYCMTLS